MKKSLSVFLALIMLLSCCPVLFGLAFAAGTQITFDEDGTFTEDNLKQNFTYTIPEGVTMTVPANFSLHIPLNCTVKVEKGGKLVIDENGELLISGTETSAGVLDVAGTIVGAENISTGKYGVAQAHVRFPSLVSVGLSDCIDVYYATSESGNAYEDLTPGFTYAKVSEDGADIPMPLNRYLYIKADIIKDGDLVNVKYDDGLMKVFLNRVEVPYAAESHRTMLVSAGDITYSRWTSDDAFLKTYRITLPKGTGYTVYGRDGEEDTAYIKFGKPFTFRVEIDEDYQMSGTTMEVYIYNGYGIVNYDHNDPSQGTVLASTPDASGFYTIPAVKNDYTVYVSMLSIPDEKVTQIGGILQTVRSIFEMIINFFRQIANAFGIGG